MKTKLQIDDKIDWTIKKLKELVSANNPNTRNEDYEYWFGFVDALQWVKGERK